LEISMEGTAHRRQSRDPDVFDHVEQVLTRIPRGHRSVTHAQMPAADDHDSMPVFLSNPDGEPDPAEFTVRTRRRSAARWRVLAAGVALASLAAFATAYLGQLPADSAKGALETAADVAATALAPQDLQAAPVPVASGASGQVITSTYQSALQSQAPAVEVPAAAQVPAALPPAAAFPEPEATPTIHHLAPEEVASLLKRGDTLIASGDVAAARLVMRRAAEAGNARAAATLAGTYDPAVLAKLGVHGIVPDMEMARAWYEKAKQFGSPEASRRLEALASKRP
jgi:TPR repeat protein